MISQPMRGASCISFLRSGATEQVILTGDARPFVDLDLDIPTSVVVVGPALRTPPITRLTRSGWVRAIPSGSPTGSRFARWLARAVNRVAWRLRYFDRLVLTRRSKTVRHADFQALERSPLYVELGQQQRGHPIQQIVVFDLFDLPAASAFARRHDLDLVVR